MRKSVVTVLIILILLFNLFLIYTPDNVTKGTAISGEYSGYLNLAGSPYIITDNVTVPFAGFLDIRPGVVLKFNEGAVLHCKGELYANGTSSQPITFTSNLATPYIGSWEGIKLQYAANCQLFYCKIQYALWGIYVELCNNVSIKDCEILKCGNGTEFQLVDKISLQNSKIHDNLNFGINATYYSNRFNITNNNIYNNYDGVRFSRTHKSNFRNNYIHDNRHGLRVELSTYLDIKKNTIENSKPVGPPPNIFSTYDNGLYVYRSYWNDIAFNRILNTSGNGLRINRSLYNSFENNYIKTASANGLRFDAYVGYNEFKNNTFLDISKAPLILGSNSRENYFKNNAFEKLATKYGVLYGTDSYWNYFEPDNKINTVVLPIYYKVSGAKITSALDNLVVSEVKLTNLGQVIIVECENFTLQKTRMQNGKYGLFLYDSHNVTIDKSRMIDNKIGIYFGFNSTNVTIYNTTISNSAKQDLFLEEYSNVTIINSTFDKSKIKNEYHSNVIIQWYAHVKVYYYNGLLKKLVKSANVKFLDKFKNLAYMGKTKSDGTIRFIRITERIINDTKTIKFNDYNVSAIKMYFQPSFAGSGVTIDQSKWINIELFRNKDPILSGLIKPSITHNRKPELSWNPGADPENDELVYWIKIKNSRTPNKILEQGLTDDTTYQVTTNLTYGERYIININASDPYGGWSNTITSFLDLINSPPSLPMILMTPVNSTKKPSKNDDLNCSVIECFDTDTNPKDIIKFSFNWYKNGKYQPKLSIKNTTKRYHVLSKEHTSTGELWTCKVTATDGFETTAPAIESRTIKNQKPRTRFPIPYIAMDEDTIDYGTIDLNRAFIDDDGDPLIFSFIITGDNISVEILKNGQVIITPNPDWSGVELLQFFASDGELQAQTTTSVTVRPINDPPMVRILTPRNNTPYPFNVSQGITLEAIVEDADIPFGDRLNLTWVSNISGVLGKEALLENIILPIGHHRLEFIAVDRENIEARDTRYIWIFDEAKPPKDIVIIELITPEPGVLKSPTIKFSWRVLNLGEAEAENVLYDIYLYREGEPEDMLLSNYVGTNITITNLEEGVKFYWTVVPFRNNTQGLCINGVWYFIIDLNFEPIYGVKLKADYTTLQLEAGKVTYFNLTIQNIGNIIDTYLLRILFNNNSDLINYSILTKDRITLRPLQSTTLTLTISLPINFSVSNLNDTITIQVISISSNLIANLSRDIKIFVPIKPEPPDKPKVEETSEEEKTPDIMDVFIIIFIILVILLIMILLFSFVLNNIRKQQKKMLLPIKIKTVVSKQRRVIK